MALGDKLEFSKVPEKILHTCTAENGPKHCKTTTVQQNTWAHYCRML